MKKFTLILSFVILGIFALPAQKNNGLFEKNNTETVAQQNDKTADNTATPKFTIIGKMMNVANVESGTTIEIYSALGAKVQTVIYNGNSISVSNLNKGVYIVRAGKHTQKIML